MKHDGLQLLENYFRSLQNLTMNELYINRSQVKSIEKEFGEILSKYAVIQKLPKNASPLDMFNLQIQNCRKCVLSKGRKNFVFGEGSATADIMFIGEGPGREEDEQGKPFVGKAGQLLNKILEAIHLKREDVFIANVVKCRPPGNRTPALDEIETCVPYLYKQIELIQPKIICLLGAVAAKGILSESRPLSQLRGRIHNFKGIDVVVTYHPAALLRNQNFKRPTWEDMKMLRKIYDEKYLKQKFILEN